jgi:tetratricopeptide (TPR) repeat protein
MGEEELKNASQTLAQRFSTAAYNTLQQGDAAQEMDAWRQAAAYLEAAAALDPDMSHYPRLLWQAMEHIGDTQGAMRALDRYLAIEKDDEVARLRLIEYFVAQQQTNDGRIKYLTWLMSKPSVSDALKSRCATWAAVALLERSRSEAIDMVKKATELDPVNIYARRLEWELAAQYGTPPERLRSLLAQLRCNPGQVHVLAGVARELAAAGMVREAARWFVATTQLSNRTRTPIDSGFFAEYAAQLYLNGELQLADQEIGKVIELDPGNIDAWFLRLTMRQAGGQRFEFDRELTQAKQYFAGRAAALARRINTVMTEAASRPVAEAPGGKPASRPFDFNAAFSTGGGTKTGPAEAPSPADAAGPSEKILADVLAKLQRPDAPPELKRDFVEALTDLAWYEVYFNRSETAATTWIDAVKTLLGSQSVTTQRLQGWLELLRRNDADAMKILWPIRNEDALAGMGVVELLAARSWAPAPAPGAPAAAPAQRPAKYDPDVLAQKLLDENPAGLIGAMLAGGLRERKLYARAGVLADPLRAEMKEFNQEIIAVVDQADQFYFLVGKPIESPYQLGKPILAQITVQNRNKFDLPIGPDGIIKPDLWFDARITLQQDKKFPMCGSDKITGALVLKAGQSMTQMVRVDQGPLNVALRQRPAGSINIFMSVMTNPMLVDGYNAIQGPGGVRKQFVDPLIRGGLPINTTTERKRLTDMISGSSLPQEKAWAIEVMAAYVEETRRANPGPRAMEFAPEMLEQVLRARSDKVPQIAAIATLTLLRTGTVIGAAEAPGTALDKPQMVRQLATSPQWETRLSAVIGAGSLTPAEAAPILKSLLKDPSPVVRSAAAAEIELAPKRAAAGAATQPATQPAN